MPRVGMGRTYLRGNVWWIEYGYRGKTYRESSKSPKESAAKKLLKKRLGEIGRGKLVGPDEERVMLDDLLRGLEQDYAIQGRKSARRVKSGLRHLRAAFGGFTALKVTTDKIREYIVQRQEAGASASTIQKELAFLKRSFNLAAEDGRLTTRPYVPAISVDNTREGFFEASDLERVVEHLPEPLRAPVRFAFLTGWRRGEVLPLRWTQVDWTAGVVRLAPGSTKNRKGREYPFRALPQLEALLEAQQATTRALERKTGQIIPYVFHRSGKPIREMYRSWRTACTAAGLEGWYFHDLRRSAVRNMERAGVSRSVAMRLSGHLTTSVYERYAITDAAVLSEGVEKLAKLHGAPPTARTVVPIREGASKG